MERRLAVHARAHRQALIAALVLASAPALAAPKGAAAKKQFDRGVKAYTANDFAGAADAMRESYALERDPETLFAWAQAERKLDDCEKAIALYGELLGYDLPAENKQVVETNISECKDILAAQQAAKTEEPPPKEPAPPPPVTPIVVQPPPPPHETTRAWWKDPVGDGLVLVGIGGLVVGGIKLASAASADSDKANATSYVDFKHFSDKATTDGKVGVIAASAGGALVVLGVIWYATHREHEQTVTGWLGPTGGGVGIAGGF
jgi:hypothetical protein